MKVMKFGGTSVGNAERIKAVAEIVARSRNEQGEVVVVSSAMEGVTNQLVDICRCAHRGDRAYETRLSELEARHLTVADQLLGPRPASRSHKFIRQSFRELDDFIHGIWILGELTSRTQDYVLSYGEQLACTLLADALERESLAAEYTDSRRLIRTDLNYGAANVNFDLTDWNVINHFKNKATLCVVTGFIACGPDNETTTLGRGGSDYTAAILGAALNAGEIEIWTDVDGVLTADPRKVSDAFPLDSLTFEEAMELSHFGAKVIHPPTMLPAMRKRIPIRIRNTFNPAFPGTIISEHADSLGKRPAKGIAGMERVSLLKVTGADTLGPAGIAARVFSVMAAQRIDVALVTQSSSEHSLCLAVAEALARSAREALELEFRVELHHGQITAITVEGDCALLAVVGERMHEISGVTGTVFNTLGRHGITPRAIAQGSSDRNVTLALDRRDLDRAMSLLHDTLFMARQAAVDVYLLGPGTVGGTLLDLLGERRAFAAETLGIPFRLCGLADSRSMVIDRQGIDLRAWRDRLRETAEPSDLLRLVREASRPSSARVVVVDCTGRGEPVAHYLALLEAGVSVVTPSKLANAGPLDFYRRLRSAARRGGAQFRYDTNVGAALPVLEAIRGIVRSGDAVQRLEAVVSGTLSFVFNRLREGESFAAAVREAVARGLAEPDPRTDLAGLDVARKLLIMVREAGEPLEMADVRQEAWLPAPVFTMEDPAAALALAEEALAERTARARENGKALMVVARWENGKAGLGLEEIPPSHPLYQLSDDENLVAITSRDLYPRPLLIRGGGAGARRTAAGLFADLEKAAGGRERGNS